ncbi:verrucotoxin subunit beta-like protein [Labeo rohita]|uniref:Verrucotoxin subunit beta-like protein n=1 Tax=Labeo rohita TaxID=84645 RepID=A0A498MRZ7_LABRO|nr:verrucotoxin subunit beta-like protein [Labeo rohita]RXN37866.1 verrucotoxin subunit beta-like protein [Labeo rohita]
MKCSDLLKDSPAVTFAAFHEQILQMKQNCHNYKLRLMNKLGCLLPNIRGDVMKETALNDFLQEHEESPFNESDLTEWLNERERESEIIKTVLRQLKDYGAQVEVNIDAILMDLEVGNLVSYTFTSLNWSDIILPKQKAYLSSSTKAENVEITPDIKQKSWLTAEIQKTMRRNLEIFKNLMNSKDCKPAKFIVSSKEMKNNPGSCILLYESGCDEAVCFQTKNPKTAPRTLTWLTGNIREKMREHLIIFKELMTSQVSQSTKFIVSSKDHENHPGSCIFLYESGCDEAVCFTPPSKPVCPITEEVKGQSVGLKVVPSSCPATVELRLLYKPKQDTDWRSEPVLEDQNTVTLTDLREETEYEIKCAAVGKLNYTRESDTITVKTGV